MQTLSPWIRNASLYAILGMQVRYWYTADPSTCMDLYIRPARKVFNFGKKEDVTRGKGLVNKEDVVKPAFSFCKQV